MNSGTRRRPWPFITLLVLSLISAAIHRRAPDLSVAILASAIVLSALLALIGWLPRLRRRRRERRRGAQGAADLDRMIATIRGLNGHEFEHWRAELLRRSGSVEVQEVGGPRDFGADIIARLPDGRRAVVQCKRHAKTLGSKDVQAFNGTAWTYHGAQVALMLTTGRPTAPALEFARLSGIVIVDAAGLARWAATGQAPIPMYGPLPPSASKAGTPG